MACDGDLVEKSHADYLVITNPIRYRADLLRNE